MSWLQHACPQQAALRCRLACQPLLEPLLQESDNLLSGDAPCRQLHQGAGSCGQSPELRLPLRASASDHVDMQQMHQQAVHQVRELVLCMSLHAPCSSLSAWHHSSAIDAADAGTLYLEG